MVWTYAKDFFGEKMSLNCQISILNLNARFLQQVPAGSQNIIGFLIFSTFISGLYIAKLGLNLLEAELPVWLHF
jgi:hypothetical protein